MARHTIVAVYATREAAVAAREALIAEGVAPDELNVTANQPVLDPIAAEAPGQSFENQPGQDDGGASLFAERLIARYGEAVRSGVCVLTCDVHTEMERARIESLMMEAGARSTWPCPL